MLKDSKLILPMLISISTKHPGHLYSMLLYMRVQGDIFEHNFGDWTLSTLE